MSVFHYQDYRQLIKDEVEKRKALDSKFNFQRMSEKTGIQKAYLSQVLGGQRDLAQDQLFKVCQFLGLGAEESDYMALLLEYARSGLSERKSFLKKKIEEWQRANLKTEKNVAVKEVTLSNESVALYYLDPLHQLVHIALDIPRFRKNPTELLNYLAISKEKLAWILTNLEKMEIVQLKEGEVKVLHHNLHLPKDSPLFWSWKTSLATMAYQHLRNNSRDKDKNYTFSVVFAADEETRLKLHQMFMDFLKDAKKFVGEAKSKEVYQMNFDLFPWT